MSCTAIDLVAEAKQHIREIDVALAMQTLEYFQVLDVREPAEYAAGCLPRAINIPRGVLEFKIDVHPSFHGKQDAEILVYCLTGGRSALAVEALQKLGWSHCVSLAGGFNSWQQAGGREISPAA